jgi:hypothetical protein
MRGSGQGGLPELRDVSMAHPNNGLHATAYREALINIAWGGA